LSSNHCCSSPAVRCIRLLRPSAPMATVTLAHPLSATPPAPPPSAPRTTSPRPRKQASANRVSSSPSSVAQRRHTLRALPSASTFALPAQTRADSRAHGCKRRVFCPVRVRALLKTHSQI
jgi:hypothetical protein